MPNVVIKNLPPPIYARALETFGLTTRDVVMNHIIFAYDHAIWNPSTREIQAHAIIHEQVHFGQQGDDSDGWWDKYLTDAKFRFEQEVPAYQTQYAWVMKNWKDRNLKAKFLHFITNNLSGKIYGTMCTYEEARKLICQ